MAKKIEGTIQLQIPAGQANPAPPIGPALGRYGVNIMEFCKKFNALTADRAGWVIPVVLTVYNDRSFTFITKTPPASDLIKKAAGVEKGSGTPNKDKVGTLTRGKLREIAQQKAVDMSAGDVEAAMRTIAGTARSMGVDVVEG